MALDTWAHGLEAQEGNLDHLAYSSKHEVSMKRKKKEETRADLLERHTLKGLSRK